MCNKYQEQCTMKIATSGRDCRDWLKGETDTSIDAIVSEKSSTCNKEDNMVIFTDGSFQKGFKSSLAYTFKVNAVGCEFSFKNSLLPPDKQAQEGDHRHRLHRTLDMDPLSRPCWYAGPTACRQSCRRGGHRQQLYHRPS